MTYVEKSLALLREYLLRDLSPEELARLVKKYGSEDNIPINELNPVGVADALATKEIMDKTGLSAAQATKLVSKYGANSALQKAIDRGYIEYIDAHGEVQVQILKDGYLYQVIPKTRLDKILEDGEILPVKIDHNAVPFMESLTDAQAAKGKIFFTPAQEMSEGLSTGTSYGPGIVNRIDVKALKDMKVYHDPHVIKEVPSFYVTEPIDSKFVSYSTDDGKTFRGYTEVAAELKTVPDKVKILINVQEEIKDFFNTTKPVMQDGMTIGFNLGRSQSGGASITVDALFDIQSAQKALENISLKAAKRALGSTGSDLEKLMSQNIKDGGGSKQLAAMISDKFNQQYLGRRSFLIARTEGTGVLNMGTLEQMKEDGIESKWWRATIDGRQRPTHEDMMKNTQDDPIPVAEDFKFPDGDGACPGDPKLPMAERANCRCALVQEGFSGLRCRYYDRLFLREHGGFERRLQQSVNIYFKKQLSRIESRTHKVITPHLTNDY